MINVANFIRENFSTNISVPLVNSFAMWAIQHEWLLNDCLLQMLVGILHFRDMRVVRLFGIRKMDQWSPVSFRMQFRKLKLYSSYES